MYGAQKKVWNIFKDLNSETYVEQCKNLYPNAEVDNEGQEKRNVNTENDNTENVTVEDIQAAIQKIKNNKIPNELVRYGATDIAKELTKLFHQRLSLPLKIQKY